MYAFRIHLAGAGDILRLIHRHGSSVAANDGHIKQGLAANGADTVLIIVGNDGDRVANVAVSTLGAGISSVSLCETGGGRHHCGILMLAGAGIDTGGGDGYSRIPGDLGQAVAVDDTGIRRRFQVLERSGRLGGDVDQLITGLQVHHEVDLTGTGAVDQTGFAVPGMDADRVLDAVAVQTLGLIHRDRGAFIAGKGHGTEDLAAYGADAVLIIMSDHGSDVVHESGLAQRAGIGSISFRCAGGRGHHRFVLMLAGGGVDIIRVVIGVAEPQGAGGDVGLQVSGIVGPVALGVSGSQKALLILSGT